jgi:hypothetical protein
LKSASSLDLLERRLRAVAAAAEARPEEAARDLALAEGEWISGRGAEEGRLALSELARWRDRTGSAEAAAAVEERVRRKAEAWRARTAQGTEALARRLREAGALDREAIERGVEPPLRGDRAAAREAFLEALRQAPPDEALRGRWAVELADRADAALLSLDDLPRDRARLLLAIEEEDLAWHAASVDAENARIRRKLRRLRAEREERELQERLEARFGPKRVARFERGMFLLLLLLLAIMFVDLFGDLSRGAYVALAAVEAAACSLFLLEFLVKLRMAPDRASFFRRHLLVDLVPSIPFGLILLHRSVWDAAQAGRAARLFRLPRLAVYVAALRPLLRLFRAFAFLTRGADRFVRQHGALLNREVVIHPTREEREGMASDADAWRARRLRAEVNRLWRRILEATPPAGREEVARARVLALAPAPMEPPAAAAPRPLVAEELLHRLERIDGEELEAEMGPEFAGSVARTVRLFAAPPLRWLPGIRGYVPRLAPGMDDAEVAAAAARRLAERLGRRLRRRQWIADLHGVITPAQFVDRVGTAMVKGSFRPAWRLTVFGAVYLLIQLLFGNVNSGFAGAVNRFLDRTLGPFLLVLGSVCVVVLGLGIWLRRIAGQATDFFDKSARAQFLETAESIKGRAIDRDAAILDRRVLAPENLLLGIAPAQGSAERRQRFASGVREWLLEAQAGGRGGGAFDAMERAILLYREGLDGAILSESDTATTAQLLGSPALRNLRLESGRLSRAENRALGKLDLDRARSAFRGPYFWFGLLSQAVVQGAAHLLVDYNRHAIPHAEIAKAGPDERERYERWLASEAAAAVPSDEVLSVTTAFTTIHFLDDDPRRDREVEARFGPRVLERLRRDRRDLFRTIFSTEPWHRLERSARSINLFEAYERWFVGGRALLLPFRLLRGALRRAAELLSWAGRAVREIRHPTFGADRAAAAEADFSAAERKIRRMRAPLVEACLLLRARCDPEYLGVPLPGSLSTPLPGADAESDLRFLRARRELEAAVETERRRAERDMARLGRLLDGGLRARLAAQVAGEGAELSPEQIRAAAVAYLGDLRGVRRNLSSAAILDEVFADAEKRPPLPRRLLPRLDLSRAFDDWWDRHGPKRRGARLRAWRAALWNVDGVADALLAYDRLGDMAEREGEATLAGYLRRPSRTTDSLVTLRAVQTLSLIDLLRYREHVHRLGGYGDSKELLSPP